MNPHFSPGHHDFTGHASMAHPMIGALMFFLLMLVLLGSFFLAKRGRLGPPPWMTQHHSPESAAKRILAERFANSDISSEEFMERASILNWTPGSEDWPKRPTGKKKRQR